MYYALVDVQVGKRFFCAGQVVHFPKDVSPDYVEYLRASKIIESLPTQESYPCVDYHDDTYLCGGKRLIKDRYHERS
ncbi:hypothetical protein [Helicobacter sp. L8]|uniref:hypothetical protein n=1 Tax=Helicobacter sp. L8 TaxID=2316078 RepID=UPI000EB05EDB|nr:hypothetical protein [Helicobacter sp. L8]